MKYLLTPSLHDAFRWYGIIEDKPKQEILDTLARQQVAQTEAMLNGIEFENRVQRVCGGEVLQLEEPYKSCVDEVAGIVKGGIWQVRLERNITIKGRPFLLYGKADIIKRDWIYDIKFSQSYDIGKYAPSIQHLAYMYMSRIEKCAYLIADGRDVAREDYFWQENSEAQLMGELTGLVNMIDADDEFRAAYYANWECKYQEAA